VKKPIIELHADLDESEARKAIAWLSRVLGVIILLGKIKKPAMNSSGSRFQLYRSPCLMFFETFEAVPTNNATGSSQNSISFLSSLP